MSGNREFWFSFNNGEKRLRLPVNPETLSIKTGWNFEDIQIAQLGEYTIIGDAGLKEISFSSFFPLNYNPSYCEYNGFDGPYGWIKYLEEWRASKRPCRLTITGTPFNFAVTIRDFEYSEKAGSAGDYDFKIVLKEYKFINVRKIDPSTPYLAVDSTPRPAELVAPQTYVTKYGDTLWGIAHKFLLNGDRWNEIYELNKDAIGRDPNTLAESTRLVLPL